MCVSVPSAHPVRGSGQEPGDVSRPPHPRDHVQVQHAVFIQRHENQCQLGSVDQCLCGGGVHVWSCQVI